ncbi:phage tail tape measure protein [Helicobacter vulpis]|uniref:phage tail tape measure protein n=1 Tax=Helicobacter vulpis TaxID=2316076 RepID=UPI000EB5293F|nr:phage tail tape measure protein [Helicobacter vulpis]
MQTELSVRIRPQLEAFRESMQAARRALSLQTSNGVIEGVRASMNQLRTSLSSNLRLGEITSTQVRAINAELRQVNTAIITQRFNQSLQAIKESVGAVVATFGAAKNTLGKPLKASIDFEESFASVKKVLNEGVNAQGVVLDGVKLNGKLMTDSQELKNKLLDLSVSLGSSTADLNKIAESAGQMGIGGSKNIADFTELVTKMSVAFDMSAEDAGKSMADIQSILGLEMKDLKMVGDTINNISNNSTARASDIIDIMKRIAGTGKGFGLSAKEIAGLGSSMLALGMTSEVAGTSLQAVMNKLGSFDKAEGKAKGLDKVFGDWFSKMGIDMDSWLEMRASAPKAALDMFLESLSKMDKVQQTKALKDMFGLEHLGKMKTLVGAMDKYKEVMGEALKDSSGSMDEEFAAKANTTAHQLKRLGAQMEILYIHLGDALLPVVNNFISAFSAMLAPIANFAKEHQSATRAIMLTMAGVLGLKAAVLSLTLLRPLAMVVFTPLLRAWTLLRYSVLGNISALLWHRGVSLASVGVSLAIRAPLLLLSGAFRLLTGQITLSSVAARIFGITSMLMANLFGGAMKLVRLALMTSGIGLFIVGLGVAIYGLIEHWDSVKAWLIEFWGSLKARLMGFWEDVKMIFQAVAQGLAPIVGVFSWVFEMLGAGIVKLLNLFGISVGGMGEVFAGLKDYVVSVWEGLLEWLKPVLDFLQKVYEWYAGIFGGVLGKVAGFLGFGGEDKNVLKDVSKLSLPTLSAQEGAPKQEALPVLGSFDLSALKGGAECA